jgi:hypothetical protein
VHKFQFDNVFGEASTQQEVFCSSTQPIIDSVMDGFNGCVFAFGQTGSGKTHTMSGPPVYHYDTVGLVPRAAQYIFKRIAELAQHKTQSISISVRLSAMEIYNEGMHDLLKEVYILRIPPILDIVRFCLLWYLSLSLTLSLSCSLIVSALYLLSRTYPT